MYRYPGNHVDSGIVTVPRKLKTRPGAPETHLAYITPDEEKILQQYKPGTPHRGPEEIPNYDTWAWDGSSGSSVTGGSTADVGSGSGSGGSGTGSYSWETSSNPWGNDYQEPYTPPDEIYGPGSATPGETGYGYTTLHPDTIENLLAGSGLSENTLKAFGYHGGGNFPNELLKMILEGSIVGANEAMYGSSTGVGTWSDLEAGKHPMFPGGTQQYYDVMSLPSLIDISNSGGGGGGGGDGRGWGSGSGWGSSQYNNPYGRYSKRNWMYKNRNADSPIAQILAQKEANKYNNQPKNQWMFTQMLQSMPGGGITNAV